MRMAVKDRYEHDHVFRRIVDTIRYTLEGSEITATEVREAVMLACEMYEYIHIRPLFIRKDEVFNAW